MIMNLRTVAALGLFAAMTLGAHAQSSIPALTIQGEHFVNPAGDPVRFWGVNLVALYPDHPRADALAENLASLGINLVRPHHNLRPSLDWNPGMPGGSLLTYRETSREFDAEALDRFDYLNAALRRHGIYLALSVNWTRRYLPGDADILPGAQEDQKAWQEAMKELASWHWKKAFDLYKMLPCIDERAALLNEEFIRRFLTHVNPHTGIAYAHDPQMITMEILNEASSEYTIICGNRFPDYWQEKLVARWEAYARENGIEPGDLYRPADARAKTVRGQFLRQLDEDYLARITKVIRSTGSRVPVTFSNLWRGDNIAAMNARTAGFIEDHMYMDPSVTKSREDGFYGLSRSALAGKPFFVGEENQAEGEANLKAQSPFRTMLPVATATYASLQDWSGIVWFAWQHGGGLVGEDGWATTEGRQSALGGMISDGMMIDHLRTTGLIFRRGLVEPSRAPITLWVDEPYIVGDYHGLMRGKYPYKAGWQNIHGIRKAFGPVPEGQAKAPWMTQSPPDPLVSDTRQITKNIARRQLTIAAPQAEAFSGYPDEAAPAGLEHLALESDGFATVVLVAGDGKPLRESARLILSRTEMADENKETRGPKLRLRGLRAPANGKQWYLVPTRPRALRTTMPEHRIEPSADGALELPPGEWRECELHFRAAPPNPESRE